jgi:lipoate-protein ligase A
LLIDPPSPGAWNMAVDELLLADAIELGVPTLRFYQWSEPTLSLGYFQPYADRATHTASQACAVVRRQTGGGAILHDRELTYSLALPAAHRLARRAPDLYRAMHEAFIAAIASCDPTGQSAAQLRVRGHDAAVTDEPFLCFQRQAAGDVVFQRKAGTGIAPSTTGTEPGRTPVWKVLGSAQRRHRGALLQHGSLLWNASPAAPELAGLKDLCSLTVEFDELTAAVSKEVAVLLSEPLIPMSYTPELKSKALALANNKYGSPDWTNRR